MAAYGAVNGKTHVSNSTKRHWRHHRQQSPPLPPPLTTPAPPPRPPPPRPPATEAAAKTEAASEKIEAATKTKTSTKPATKKPAAGPLVSFGIHESEPAQSVAIVVSDEPHSLLSPHQLAVDRSTGMSVPNVHSERPDGSDDDKEWEPENIEIHHKIASLSASAEQFRFMKTKMLRMREMHKVAALHYTRFYYALMIPSLVLSMVLSISSAIIKDHVIYQVFVAVVSALNSLLLSLVAFLKLQSTMDQHKKSVEMYDNLFTEFEFEQELRFLEPENDEHIKVTLMGKLEQAREKILKLKQDCPAIPAWVTTAMIPTSGGNSRWENVVKLEQGAELKEIMKPVIWKLKMQDKQTGVAKDEERSKDYAALLADASEAVKRMHEASDAAKEDRLTVINKIIAMLSNCKKLHARKLPPPLADTEYNGLMQQYALLKGADMSSLNQEITDFTKNVLQVRCLAKLSKWNQFSGSPLQLPSDDFYEELKSEAMKTGERLQKKLCIVHGDPLLTSHSDETYNNIVKAMRSLSKPLTRSDTAPHHVLQPLLEVEVIGQLYHAGLHDILSNEDYDLKKRRALEIASAAADSPDLPPAVRSKLIKKLKELNESLTLPSESAALMKILLEKSQHDVCS